MKVVIIDYGAGNIFSIQQAFRRLGVNAILTSNELEIRNASHVIFPGVGHARSAMEQLKASGLDKVIPTLKQPVLGICLGMQLMCGYNEEGNLDGLGIFSTEVIEFAVKSVVAIDAIITTENKIINADLSNYQVPHMGWNEVVENENSEAFYFVHSYYVPICKYTWGVTEYPFPFSSSLKKDNFWGVQFHPEKSGKAGEELIKKFLDL